MPTTTVACSQEAIEALFAPPFMDWLARAHAVHAAHHDPHAVQMSTLLSLKTGGSPEDRAYCPQPQQHDTGVQMSDELQALCFFAGAAPIFVGDKLFTTDNPDRGHDARLPQRLDMRAMAAQATPQATMANTATAADTALAKSVA